MIHRSHVAAVLVTMALGVAGCTSDDDRPEVDGTVVQPGKPGEESTVLDEAPEVERADANDADAAFMQMMVPHHAQALEMAELAPDAGGSAAVRTLADRIDGAQRPEILLMASWLEGKGLDAPTKEQIESGDVPMQSFTALHEHGHDDVHDMPGMAGEADMAALADARGTAFDRQFLTLMIAHHQGAIAMVDDVVQDGSDFQVDELAASIAADQSAEIDRMRQLLADL